MTSPRVIDIGTSYKALHVAKRIAAVDGTILLGLLGWALLDRVLTHRKARQR